MSAQKMFKLGKDRTKDSRGLTKMSHKWKARSQSPESQFEKEAHLQLC